MKLLVRRDESSDDDDDDFEGSAVPRRLVKIAVVVVPMVVVGGLVGLLLRDDEPVASVTPTIGSQTGSDVASTTLVTSLQTASTTALTSPSAAVAPTLAVPTGPLTIQFVPPIRDVIVRVGNTTMSSDASGRVVLTAEQRTEAIEYRGLEAEPSLLQLDLLEWSDGATGPTRRGAAIVGPLVQVGLEVSTRVIVVVAPGGQPASKVRFASTIGPVIVPINQPTWVPSAKAVKTAGGLVSQPLVYAAEALLIDEEQVVLPYQEFVADPEARWTVVSS